MTLRKGPGGVWRIEFQLAGVRVHRSARTRDRKAAEELEVRLRAEVYAGRILGRPRRDRVTVRAAFDRYLAEHLRPNTRRRETLESNVWLFDRLAKLLGARRDLSEIGAAEVARLKARIVRDGGSKATANRYLAMLRAVMRKANREWEAIPSVPPFALYRLDNERTRVLSADEELRLLRAAERNPALLRLVRFLLTTGARLGEALGLTWDRVVLEHPTRRPHVVFTRTKNGETRSVPLPERTAEMLRRMREDPESEASPHVFLCRHDGKLGPYRRPFDAFRRACREAGVADFRIHDLRHTYATRLVRQGVPIYSVGKLLGHRDARMTARYAHLEGGDLDAVADLL